MTKKNRLPIDFDVSNPARMVTDPNRAENDAIGVPANVDYPKHMVKPDLVSFGGPANRELVVAQDGADERRYAAQGYMSHQEADVAERRAQDKPAPKAKVADNLLDRAAAKVKPPTARKPANRKPKVKAE